MAPGHCTPMQICSAVLLLVGLSWCVGAAAAGRAAGGDDPCPSNWLPRLSRGVLPYAVRGLHTNETVVLRGVRVIDPARSTHTAYENCSVAFCRGLITAVALDGEPFDAPPGAVERSLPGHTLMPGLIGMHEHLFYPAALGSGLYSIATDTAPKLYLSQGVTTARTAGTMHPYADINVVEQINSGEVPGPRIFPTAPYLESASNPLVQMASLHNAPEAREMVAYWQSQGFDNFKAYMYLTRELLGASIDTAHKLGSKVTGHLCAVTFSEAIDLGIDCLEHGLLTATDFVANKEPDVCPAGSALIDSIAELSVADAAVQSLIAKLVAHNVTITSTLAVFETFVPGRPGAPDYVLDKMLPEARADYTKMRKLIDAGGPSAWNAAFQREMEFEVAFVAAGGLLQAGADPTGYGGVIGGYGDVRNIELLVEAGFGEIEALKIASTNAAQYLGLSQCMGSLRVGALADLVVVRGAPDLDIACMREVALVVKDGVAYDPDALAGAAKERVSWV